MVGKSTSLSTRVRAALGRFRREKRAAVSPILALALIPIIFTMGFATELSSWWLMQRSLQHAADSAALVAATDAGNYPNNTTCGSAQGYQCAAPTSPVNCNQATTDPQHSWYCQAIATAAKYGYVNGVNTVVVTPQAGLCTSFGINLTGGFTNSWCFKVEVQKDLPVFLLGIMGFHGNQTIAGVHYQQIGAHALASVPGPPLDFCLLTTDGDILANGSPKANLNGCDSFSNGNTTCNGNGIGTGLSFESGPSGVNKVDSCTQTGAAGTGEIEQTYQCDPYGATTQNFPYQGGTPDTVGTYSESCPTATNASGNVPAMTGCTSAIATANSNAAANKTPTIPSANVIDQADINGTATGAYPGANAATMTIAGTSMQVIQVCGTAMLTNTAPTAATDTPPSCTSTLAYSGSSSNLVIIIYDGGLHMNGCTLQSATPTSTGGAVSIIFAPVTQSAGQTCDVICVPQVSNSNGSTGTIQIGAPLAGPFSGIAIMQSQFFSADKGCKNATTGGPVDWCNAGNSPTLDIQGLLYMPQTDIQFAGAISKFQPNALNCLGMIVKAFETSGGGAVINNNSFVSSITGQCTQAGVTLPGVPGTHTYYQALVG